ncbi:hypothetical protein VTK56DRAFT_6480 [Thermocarpiscus australiensis]
MEWDGTSTHLQSADSQNRGSSEVPNRNEVLESLKREIEAWCNGRPDVASLSLEEAYDELRHLDVTEQTLLTDHDVYPKVNENWEIRNWKRAKAQEIVRAFDLRRNMLRARAMDLSRPKSRPLKAVDLPLEILRNIFDEFQDEAVKNTDHKIDWEVYYDDSDDYRYHPTRREMCQQRRVLRDQRSGTIRSARLACRLFHWLASPLMFPTLPLQLSQSSLDLAEKVSRNTCIAAGVRGIQVSLGYRPEQFATSIMRFVVARLQNVERWKQSIVSADKYAGEDTGERAAERQEASWRIDCIRDAWRPYVNALISHPTIGYTRDWAASEYQHIFRQGHDEFRRLHQEERRLLTDGRFVKCLAAAAGRMGNVYSLSFIDDMHKERYRYYPKDKNALLPVNAEILTRFVAEPLTWKEIEEGGIAELDCVRILPELPIALRRAGVTLTQMDVAVLPLFSHFPLLCPRLEDAPERQAWDELSAACEDLDIFQLQGARDSEIPRERLADDWHLDNYIGSILAGCWRRLRTLDLNLTCLGPGHTWGDEIDEATGFYPAGRILSALKELPNLRHLRIEGLALQQAELDAFCSKLTDKLKELKMEAIELQDGRWERVADILRRKLAGRHSNAEDFDIYLCSLLGGEFLEMEDIQRELEHENEDVLLFPPLRPGWPGRMMEEMEMYMLGYRDDNPLRDVRQFVAVCGSELDIRYQELQ